MEFCTSPELWLHQHCRDRTELSRPWRPPLLVLCVLFVLFVLCLLCVSQLLAVKVIKVNTTAVHVLPKIVKVKTAAGG